MSRTIKLKSERYSTGKYMVYTPAPYPRRVGHVAGGKDRWHAEMGPLSLGCFKTKKLAVKAIADSLKLTPS